MREVLAVVLTIVVVGSLTVHAQDWPRYRGPDSDGRSAAEGVFEDGFGLAVAWKRPLGSGYSGIAVAEGTLVTMGSDGTSDVVVALDPATGAERWRTVVEPTYRGHDGSHDGPIATPLIAHGKVFALGAAGRFVALDLATGDVLWSRHLKDELEAPAPYYGFGSSPLFEGGRVLLQVGGAAGTLAAFDPASGKLVWTAGEASVDYQSPSIDTASAERLLLVAGGDKVHAVAPGDGSIRWTHVHGGRGHLGAGSMSPVPVGSGAYFLAHSFGGSRVFDLQPVEGGFATNVRWEEPSIRNSYNVPVYHDGHVYAFSARFLTAVDAADGTAQWKSRTPGDGFLILVDGHLVILTKTGHVAVGAARPAGFATAAALDVFDDLAWTAPAFADGAIFVRSLSGIARVSVVRARAAATAAAEPVGLMAALAASVAASEQPAAVVDRFLAAHPERPILEDGLIHFVYRGEGTDVAFGGDLLGTRREEPMTRVADTDLFYYTAAVPPGSRINYVFVRDYEAIVDPGNPRRTTAAFWRGELEPAHGGQGQLEMSWVATPPWSAPAHLDPLPEGVPRGTLVEHDVTDAARLKVWLPPGYADSGKRYPVVYVDGVAALDRGGWALALNHLVGERIEPAIVVFADWRGTPPAAYEQFYAETVVPFVDGRYRTAAHAERRAIVGIGPRGFAVLALGLARQDVFGGVGAQSAFVYSPGLGGLEEVLASIERTDARIYLDWATWDLRNPYENWDAGAANRRIAAALRERGFAVTGGEVADGLGWANWRQRTDDLLEALLPLRE